MSRREEIEQRLNQIADDAAALHAHARAGAVPANEEYVAALATSVEFMARLQVLLLRHGPYGRDEVVPI